MTCTLGKEHVCCTRIEHLGVHVGSKAILSDINLHLHCGELTAVVGRNGAGKSTFIKALLNVIPHTGSIIFEGERCVGKCHKEHTADHDRFCPVHKTERFVTAKPRFGYVPQSLAVDASSPVSVEDVVLSSVSSRPVWLRHRKKDKDLVQRILSVTGAQNVAHNTVGELSGGELQRVMLSLAITPVPDILLLDEPVSGVDRAGLNSFYELVSSLRRNYDITILLVSHDLDLVARHADRVVFIHNTSAVVGSLAEVYARSDFIETFGHIAVQK